MSLWIWLCNHTYIHTYCWEQMGKGTYFKYNSLRCYTEEIAKCMAIPRTENSEQSADELEKAAVNRCFPHL